MVTKKILPVRDVRQDLSHLLDEAANGEPVLITRHGRPSGRLSHRLRSPEPAV